MSKITGVTVQYVIIFVDISMETIRLLSLFLFFHLGFGDIEHFLQVGEEKSNKVERSSSVKYWDPSAPSTSKMDYSTYNDEEELGQMLSNSDNFDERKKIRARIKELRDAHMREWEAKQKAREAAAEDIIKKKHREADALKQQKLEQFKKQAAEHSEAKHLDVAEQHLREKVRIADEQKKKQLEEYNQRAAVHQESTHLEVSERALQERIKQADILKQKTLDAYDKAAGKTGMSQTTTVHTDVSTDGKTVTTTRRVETTTKVGGAAGKPAGGRGAMNAFKQMDAKNPAPKTNAPGGGRPNITRSPSAIKTMLLEWCKAMTREYADTIEITNFSSCWNNGIAFCALIHHFYPEAFDFKALDPKQRRKNFELAFDTAEKYADIAPLLDVEDMVRMQKPDWKCVFTYVQSFYRKLANHERNKAAVPPSDG
ncbi:hypothetical protein ACF0H5_016946 [Mactra antiquata]